MSRASGPGHSRPTAVIVIAADERSAEIVIEGRRQVVTGAAPKETRRAALEVATGYAAWIEQPVLVDARDRSRHWLLEATPSGVVHAASDSASARSKSFVPRPGPVDQANETGVQRIAKWPWWSPRRAARAWIVKIAPDGRVRVADPQQAATIFITHVSGLANNVAIGDGNYLSMTVDQGDLVGLLEAASELGLDKEARNELARVVSGSDDPRVKRKRLGVFADKIKSGGYSLAGNVTANIVANQILDLGKKFLGG